MKRVAIVAFCLALSALASFAQIASPDSSVLQLQKNEAFVIMNDLPLYQEQSGNLKWKESLVIGDKVTLLNRTYKFKIEGNEREYLKVRSPSGTEGWVRTQYVVPKCQLAVVRAEKATVYSEARDVKMTSKTVSQMTMVASLIDGSTPAFAKVVCYDANLDKYYTDAIFLSKDDLTYADADISALILYMTAMSSKDKGMRAKFFGNIEKNYSSTLFFDKIKAALVPDAPAAKPSSPLSGFFTVNDNNVNVRAQPDEVNGQVVAQLSNGAKVEVVEASTQTYTVGGQTAAWYRIKEPAGWVFGSFLSPAQ
jgi:SH3-like domain-containing protein